MAPKSIYSLFEGNYCMSDFILHRSGTLVAIFLDSDSTFILCTFLLYRKNMESHFVYLQCVTIQP